MKHVRAKIPHEPQKDCALDAVCGAVLVEVKVDGPKSEQKTIHERELLVDETWQSDCAACRKPLLRHIADRVQNGSDLTTVCGAEPIAPTVAAGMASDCDDCRTVLGVALVRDKKWSGETYGVRPEAAFEPEPMADADEICASARANRL